jgi:hypothetical protein
VVGQVSEPDYRAILRTPTSRLIEDRVWVDNAIDRILGKHEK